jgi:hypothetical protein
MHQKRCLKCTKLKVRKVGAACGAGDTPADPLESTTTSTTTLEPSTHTSEPTETTSQPPLGVITSSGPFEHTICRSEQFTFNSPPHTFFVIEEMFYGVTPSGQCEPFSPSHCTLPVVSTCNMEESCHFHLLNDVVIDDCQSSNASYLHIVYSFIPCRCCLPSYQLGQHSLTLCSKTQTNRPTDTT